LTVAKFVCVRSVHAIAVWIHSRQM